MNDANAIVRDELAAYPRGARNSAWRHFRMVNVALRPNSLGRAPEVPNSREAVHGAAVRLVGRWFPNFRASLPGGAV
jgi:hypothetical protein